MKNSILLFVITVMVFGMVGCNSEAEEISIISLKKKGMDYGNIFANKVLGTDDPEIIIEAMDEYRIEIEKIEPEIEKAWEKVKNNRKKYEELRKAYSVMSKEYVNEQNNIAKAIKVIWKDYKDDEEVQDAFDAMITVLKKKDPWKKSK